MIRTLLAFWPALIPFALYFIWLMLLRKEKTRQRLTSGPLFWTILASVAIALLCFLFWSGHQEGTTRGRYVPPQYGPGTLVPGGVEPREKK